MQLALHSAAEVEPTMINLPKVLMKLKTFRKNSHSDFARKPSEIMLTNEGENDPGILPAIFVEYIQRRNIFFADLFGTMDQSHDTGHSKAKLTLYWQYLQAWVSLGFSRYPPNACTKSLAHDAQESPGGGSKTANSPGSQRICNPLKQVR